MGEYVKTLSKGEIWRLDFLMILVTLGTQDKSFERLLKAIEKQVKKGTIQEEVIVQAGYTKYSSDSMKIFDLVDPKKLDRLMKEARIIITHGGVGSILGALKYGKPVIAAARLSKYGEHTNDHQKQIVEEFEKEGYLLALRDFQKLDQFLLKCNTFKPKRYRSNNKNFVKIVEDYIEEENHVSWWNRYYKVMIGILMVLILVFIFLIGR